MTPIRLPFAALMTVGLTVSAAAQFLAPGMPMPGQGAPQQAPPCYNEFAPLKAEAEKRGLAVKTATEKKDKVRAKAPKEADSAKRLIGLPLRKPRATDTGATNPDKIGLP